MKEETQKHLIYIHGLGSDASSRKYQLLQAFYKGRRSTDCLEWKEHDNITYLLEETVARLHSNCTELLIVGDSTGGNLAYQLRELLKKSNINISLILLNPLLDVSKRKRDIALGDNLLNYLQPIQRPTNCTIILSKNDEVIDHSWLAVLVLEGLEIIEVEDTHRMLNFKEYIDCLPSTPRPFAQPSCEAIKELS